MNFDGAKINTDYKNMIKILNYCYHANGRNDDLGALLGVLSIDIWKDNGPTDIADYNIWLECVSSIADNDIVSKVVFFLERLMDQFGFQFRSTILFLERLSSEEVDKMTK